MLLGGCGENDLSTYRTTGTVSFQDGEPVVGSMVQFRTSHDGKPVVARGTTKDDGSFELTTFVSGDGAIAGEHQAMLAPPSFTGDRDSAAMRIPPKVLPDKYTSFRTSGLSFTVEPNGENSFQVMVDRPQKGR